jgi:hypothetical protein
VYSQIVSCKVRTARRIVKSLVKRFENELATSTSLVESEGLDPSIYLQALYSRDSRFDESLFCRRQKRRIVLPRRLPCSVCQAKEHYSLFLCGSRRGSRVQTVQALSTSGRTWNAGLDREFRGSFPCDAADY